MNILHLIFLLGYCFSNMVQTNLAGGVLDCSIVDFTTMNSFNSFRAFYFLTDPSGYENAAWDASTPTGDYLSYASTDETFFYTRIGDWYYGDENLIASGFNRVSAANSTRGCAVNDDGSTWTYSPLTNCGGDSIDCTVSEDFSKMFVINSTGNDLYRHTGAQTYDLYSNKIDCKYIDIFMPSDQEWIVAISQDNKVYVIRINLSPYYPEWKEIPISGDINGGAYNGMSVAEDGTMCLLSNYGALGGYNLIHAKMFSWSCDGIPSHQSNACSGKGICVEEDNCACYEGYTGEGTEDCEGGDPPPVEEDEDGYIRIFGTNETNVVGVYECATDNATISGRNSAAGGYFRNNKIYVFGGEGIDSNGTEGVLNDIWMFDNDDGDQNWCFIGGSQEAGQPNNIVGLTFAPTNWPSSRYGMGHFTSMFSLFVFGGADSNNEPNNELWEFQIIGSSKHEWRILHENTNETTDDQPTPRYFSCVGHKTDLSDTVFFFGGETINSTFLNDLWNYSIQTNTFSRIREGSDIDEFVDNEKFIVEDHYLSQKLLNNNSDLVPPRRSRSICWLDSSENSNFYVFGGEFPNSYSSNDLWVHNTTTQNWIYLDGGTSTFLNTLDSSKNTFSSINLPSPRSGSVFFPYFNNPSDSNSIVFFGGIESSIGYDWGDLWVFSNTLLQFKFVNVTSQDVGRKNIGPGNDDIIGSRSYGLGITKQTNNHILIFGGRVLSERT